MINNDYIGYTLAEVQEILDRNNQKYTVVEVFDTKKSKIGNDCRIVKVATQDNEIILYVSYF